MKKHTGPATLVGLALALSGAIVGQALPEASDSILNGAFSGELTRGWQREARDLVGYHNITMLKDGGVRVAKEMCGRARLFQEVKLTGLDQTFSTRAKFTARVTMPGYYAYSAIRLEFLDSAGVVLGETRLVRTAGAAPWKNSGRLHLLPVTRPDAWLNLSLDIADELKSHLPGVDRTRVRRMRLGFEAFGSGSDAC